METLNRKVVVITGASSGLGSEIAYQLAREGCELVLAARRLDRLEDVARICRVAGAEAHCVETDVTREEDVQRLVAQTIALCGRIDGFINNAGVTLFSPIEAGPIEAHRRVIETNLFGPMYAARSVLPVFRRQHSGVMINVGSILSKIGQAFVPSYVISKFGLYGLSEALRVELADEPDVHVCTLFPYAMNTPHFESGGNVIGLRPQALPPAQPPQKVARAVVELLQRPHRVRHVPRIAVLGFALHWIWPRLTEQLLLHALERWHFSTSVEAPTAGNLFEPSKGNAAVEGNSPPPIGMAAFGSWLGLELGRLERQRISRRVRRALSPRVRARHEERAHVGHGAVL